MEAHLRRLRQRAPISSAEEKALLKLVADSRRFGADETLVSSEQRLDESLLLLEGWLARAKDRNSGKRQITQLHVPGDFADLHAFTLKRLDHHVISLSAGVVAVIPHERLERLTIDHPRLARMYWFLTNVDAAIHRQWAFLLGGASSAQRMAHLFCELFVRLEAVGRTRGDAYDFPITQDELAMCLGLTPVHVNRTLQELRRKELVQVEAQIVRIPDFGAFARFAQFNPSYLYHDPVTI